jgi:N6-adenosine-specific RNA methylase IME4
MPVNDVCKERAALCLWATGPFLDRQIDTMNRWGFHYRGVAQVWVKTRKDGQVIGAQGGVPTFVKSKCEFLLYGTTCKSGRPFTVHDFTVRQAVLAPVERHSKKPDVFRANLDRLCGPDTRKLELFARSRWDAPGWFQSGLEFNGVDYRDGDLIGPQG